MKKFTALAFLTISSGAFALDQYLPVAQNKLETDLEFNYISASGVYDNGGSKQKASGSPSLMIPALQLKYGIIPGLDAEVYAEYDFRNSDYAADYVGDSSSESGLARPELALKYANPDLGIGGFVNVALPLGSKKIAANGTSKVPTAITVGAIYGKSVGQIVTNAFADYEYNTEDGAKYKQDAIEAYAQGQYNITPLVGPYLGVDFTKTLNGETDGTGDSPSTAGHLLTLKPGANFAINDKFAVELNVPVTVLGANAPDYWGVYVGAYYTFSL